MNNRTTTRNVLNHRAAQLSKIFGFPVRYFPGSKTYGRPHCFGPDEACGEYNRHRVGLASDSAAGLLEVVDAYLKGRDDAARQS